MTLGNWFLMVPDVRTNITYHLEQLVFNKLCLKTLLYSHSPPKTRSGRGWGMGGPLRLWWSFWYFHHHGTQDWWGTGPGMITRPIRHLYQAQSINPKIAHFCLFSKEKASNNGRHGKCGRLNKLIYFFGFNTQTHQTIYIYLEFKISYDPAPLQNKYCQQNRVDVDITTGWLGSDYLPAISDIYRATLQSCW